MRNSRSKWTCAASIRLSFPAPLGPTTRTSVPGGGVPCLGVVWLRHGPAPSALRPARTRTHQGGALHGMGGLVDPFRAAPTAAAGLDQAQKAVHDRLRARSCQPVRAGGRDAAHPPNPDRIAPHDGEALVPRVPGRQDRGRKFRDGHSLRPRFADMLRRHVVMTGKGQAAVQVYLDNRLAMRIRVSRLRISLTPSCLVHLFCAETLLATVISAPDGNIHELAPARRVIHQQDDAQIQGLLPWASPSASAAQSVVIPALGSRAS